MQAVFINSLPETWIVALTDVIANKLASPEAAPAMAVLGDAAHGTSWRLGFSLQAAVESAVALGAALQAAGSLGQALHALNEQRAETTAALANLDRLVRSLTV
jgi:2-polyprenyl-6-methoxyphenol hydroxylase-like FAD-dependent oxidoreductase